MEDKKVIEVKEEVQIGQHILEVGDTIELDEKYKMPSDYERFRTAFSHVNEYMKDIKSAVSSGTEWEIGKGLENISYSITSFDKALKTLRKSFEKAVKANKK